jgi:hypothetical protein
VFQLLDFIACGIFGSLRDFKDFQLLFFSQVSRHKKGSCKCVSKNAYPIKNADSFLACCILERLGEVLGVWLN